MCNTECVLKGEGEQLGSEDRGLFIADRTLKAGRGAEVMIREGSWEKTVEKSVGV